MPSTWMPALGLSKRQFACLAASVCAVFILTISLLEPPRSGQLYHKLTQSISHSTKNLVVGQETQHGQSEDGNNAYAIFLAANLVAANETDINTDKYFVGARLLVYQLLHDPETRTKRHFDVVVATTPQVKEEKRERLRKDGATVISVGGVRQGLGESVLSYLAERHAEASFAVTSAQLRIQLRAENQSTSAHDEVIQRLLALQNDVQQHLDLTKTRQDATQQRLQELSIELEDEEDDGSQREAALGEVRSRFQVLEGDQVSSGVIYAQIRSNVTRQSIEDITTADNSTAFIGLPQAVVGKIDQRIRGVRTTNNSKAVVAVFSDAINMNDF